MHWRISKWFPHLEAESLKKLESYQFEIAKWNPKINLISPATVDEMDLIHFADCLFGLEIILKHINPHGLSTFPHPFYDIGSGNGFPGMVLSIVRPSAIVVCIESDERKGAFLRQLALKLGLKNLKVETCRVESLRSCEVSIGMSRAFASIEKSLTLTEKIFAPNSLYFHFKGQNWEKEIEESKICSTWNSFFLGDYKIPPSLSDEVEIGSNEVRRAIILSKR